MKTLKERLKANGLTIGSWISLGHTAVAEIMTKAGFDWLAIDMEHSVITLSEAQALIQVIELSGVVPLVRVGKNDPYIIKRIMDAGSHGVIVPMVNTKEDAIEAVMAVKYPPMGKRGVGLARAQGYGLDFEKYRKRINKESIVIVQIEHVDAVENLEEILEVDGVDGSIIGPYDLSASIGYPGEFERKKVKRLIDSYVKCCRKLCKPAGFHVVSPDPEKIKEKIKRGYTFLAFGFDALFLGAACKEGLASIRKA